MEPQPIRRRAPKGAGALLHDELIAAATALLAETGDESQVSIREVARRAQVSPPAVYLHFADKAALLQSVLESQFDLLAQYVTQALQDAGGPAAALRAGCRAYLDFAHDQPGTYRTLFGGWQPSAPDGDRLDTMSGRAAFSQLVAGVQACHDVGAVRPGDAVQDATLIWIGLHGGISLRQARPDFPWPPTPELLDELLHRLVGLPHGTA